eukprot:g10095.t1
MQVFLGWRSFHPFGILRTATQFAKDNNVTIHVFTESDESSRDVIARAQLAIARRKREAAEREAAVRRKAKVARRQQVVRAAKVAAAAAAAAASAGVEAALSMAAESDPEDLGNGQRGGNARYPRQADRYRRSPEGNVRASGRQGLCHNANRAPDHP